ncbi:UNVERIFIED_CONTAM: putative ribonuclease H protein [Sesamum latifolium]|uniref:Ribonuclease H protein n=1 Tax=Sesamum latifolium TaxID=2727402 RepID=A0AAW2WSM6_9LAMI
MLIQSWKIRIGTKPHIRDVIPLLILWNIWNLRNDSKYEGVVFKASIIIRKTMTYLHNLHKSGIMKTDHAQGDLFAMNSLHIHLQPKAQRQKAIIVHWRKPQEGWYKMNTDGASKGNPGISGAGGILRDQLGRVIFAFQEPLGNITNTQAELQAIHRGLQICIDRGFRNVWIETDATAIIKLISAPQRGAWNLQAILQTTRCCCTLLSVIYYSCYWGIFVLFFCAVSVAPFGAVFGAGGGVFWGRLRAGLIAVVLPLLQRYAAADLYCRCYFIAAARGSFLLLLCFLVAHLGAVWGLVLGLFGDCFLGTVEGYFTAVMLLLGAAVGGLFWGCFWSGLGTILGQLRTFYLLFLGLGLFSLHMVLVGSDDSSVVAETFWTHRIIVTNFTHATSLFVRE